MRAKVGMHAIPIALPIAIKAVMLTTLVGINAVLALEPGVCLPLASDNPFRFDRLDSYS